MTRYTHVKCQSSGTHSFKNRQLTRLKFSKIAQTPRSHGEKYWYPQEGLVW